MAHFNDDPTTERSASALPAVLQAEGLYFRYPQRDLFANRSIRIPPGVALVRGGEGSGKTTLLRMLAGVLPADRGLLEVNGICLHEQPSEYRKHVFWADARSGAFDSMTAAGYFQSQHPHHAGFDEPKLAILVEGFSLTAHLDKPLYMLSTGSKRKVWLAAAFSSGAAVTLLDDPFAALDSTSVRLALELLHDAADHPARAWVVADYQAPGNVPLAAIIDLGD